MDERTKKAIIELIQRGDELPEEYTAALFPTTKKEYELKYAGKVREQTILNDTMSVPFQAVKHFGKAKEGDWTNMLIFGDNLQALKHLLKLKNEGKLRNPDGSNGVKLVYIDPPFATKQDFQGKEGQKAYQDKIAGAEFIEFIRKRLVLLRELLTPDGAIYVHLDQKKAHYIKVIMDEVFGEENYKNQIIWQRTDPHNDAIKQYGKIHDIIFYYAFASNKFRWDKITTELSHRALKEYSWMRLSSGKIVKLEEPLPVGARIIKLNDATQKGTNPKRQFEWRGVKIKPGIQWLGTKEEMEEKLRTGELFLPKFPQGARRCKVGYLDEREEEGQVVQDIWQDTGRMKGGSGVYPTQKPEPLLERIILASSDEGDIVLDCFAGSGTTGAVAEKLKRKWLLVDCGKLSVYLMQKRLMELAEDVGNKGKALKHKPFTFHHAGLYYDGELLQQMQSDEYKEFVIELFGCQKRDHKINGLAMHGTLNNHSVMVFDKEHFLTHEFIDDVHKNIGSSIKDTLYLIAPVGVVGFNEDYVKRGDKKYIVLRIPNSIIAHIREQNFTKLKQPRSANDVNQTIDAVGFDFVYPPKVKAKYGSEKPKGKLTEKEYFIEIQEFEPVQIGSNIVEFKDPKAESLAMVMIDTNYNGETFNLGKYFFGDEIAKNNFTVRWDEEIGEKVMVIFLDIFGNEKKEVLTKSDFTRK